MGVFLAPKTLKSPSEMKSLALSSSEPENNLDEWQTQKKQKKVNPEWWDDAEQVVVDQLPDNINGNVIYKIRGYNC